MGRNLTSIEIKDKLEQYRLKKQAEKEKKRAKRKLQYQNNLKRIYKAQDKAIQEAKKAFTDKLIEEEKKYAQEPPKWLTTKEYDDIGNSLFDETKLYTKEELINIEIICPNEQGCIRWDVWDKLIEKTKETITNFLS